MPVGVVALLFSDDDFLGFPVSLVPATKPAEIVEAAAIERVAQLTKSLLQILVGGLVAAQQVLVVAEQEEHEDAQKRGQGHYHD